MLNTLKNRLQNRNEKGMTLIELLGVLVIIGILFVVLNSAINSSTDAAKLAGVKTDFRSIQMALEQQVREDSALPANAQKVNAYSDIQFGDGTLKGKDGSVLPTGQSDKETPQGGHYFLDTTTAGKVVIKATDSQGGEIAKMTVTAGANGNPEFVTDGLGRELDTTKVVTP